MSQRPHPPRLAPLPPRALAIASAIACAAALVVSSGFASATVENAILAPDDGVALDNFGWSVDVDGDVIAVGAPNADINGNSSQGAVYIFELSSGVWTQTAKLTAPDGVAFDQFGFDVGISGDLLVAGAEEAPVGPNSSQGVAYIFQRDALDPAVWNMVKRLEAPTSIENLAEYGHAVDIDGDLVVVGAPKASSDASGLAYLYRRDQGGPDNWGQVKQLADDTSDSNAGFGTGVALDGDLVVVGAELLDKVLGTFNNEGGAYVFQRNQGGAENWGQVAKLFGSTASGNDRGGRGVAIEGLTIAMGAWSAEAGGTSRGQLYLFTSDTGALNSWVEVAARGASDGGNFDYFARSVALLDGQAISGGHGHSSSQGQGYRFARDEGGANAWGEAELFTASDAANNRYLGYAVAAQGAHIVLGAWGNGVGQVYVYDAPTVTTAAPAGGPPLAPAALRLLPAQPNPFNPATTLAFELDRAAFVDLSIYDVRGQRVRGVLQQSMPAGRHQVTWRAEGLASGVYVARAVAGGDVAQQRCTLVK